MLPVARYPNSHPPQPRHHNNTPPRFQRRVLEATSCILIASVCVNTLTIMKLVTMARTSVKITSITAPKSSNQRAVEISHRSTLLETRSLQNLANSSQKANVG